MACRRNDALDIADLLIGFNPLQDDIADFVSFGDSGSDSTFSVDRDGTGAAHTMQQIALIEDHTGLIA